MWKLTAIVGLFGLGCDGSSDTVAVDAGAAIAASTKLGELLWHASCPVQEVDGACIALDLAVPPVHCGPESKRAAIAVPRDARKKAAALAVFADVIRRGDDPELRYDLALAKLYEGDALREAALEIAFPKDLDFEPTDNAVNQASAQRFDAWLKARLAARDLAAAKYAEVLGMHEPATTIAASARTAQLVEDFADQLFEIEIPASIRTGEHADDKVDAYCDKMTAVAEPVLTAAIDSYAACLAKATALDWFSEWSALCETALNRLEPAQFPALNELHLTTDLDYAHQNALTQAAIVAAPGSAQPRIDAGRLALQVRKYDVAKQRFAEAVALSPDRYDAVIGLGIAQRGLGDLDGAEASYETARGIDPTKGDAYYDLGVLYKDFRANAQGDRDASSGLRRALAMYEHARGLFTQFLDRTASPSDQAAAKTNIDDCTKLMTQIEAFLAP